MSEGFDKAVQEKNQPGETKGYRPILCLDFDGVLHSYTSGWKGAVNIPDIPVPGAMQFLYHAVVFSPFDVYIFSSRTNQPGGMQAMIKWVEFWAAKDLKDAEWTDAIFWPTFKPSAMVTIDDRAITFTGKWPSFESLLAFKPWNKK